MTAAVDAGEQVVAGRAIDGDTFLLADGRTLKLADVEAIRPPPGREDDGPWRLSDAARRRLDGLVAGEALVIAPVAERLDRYGRTIARAERAADGIDVARTLIDDGLARVWPSPGATRDLAPLFAAEGAARAAGRGLWAFPHLGVRPPDDIGPLDRPGVVEGDVIAAGEGGGRSYLDFTEDWRRGFSISVDRTVRRAIDAGRHPFTALVGCRLRVRGWLHWLNGPRIDVTHPAQIEVVTCPDE